MYLFTWSCCGCFLGLALDTELLAVLLEDGRSMTACLAGLVPRDDEEPEPVVSLEVCSAGLEGALVSLVAVELLGDLAMYSFRSYLARMKVSTALEVKRCECDYAILK